MSDHFDLDDNDEHDSDCDVTYDEFIESFESLEANPHRFGQLVLHYPGRDIALAMDGATASRLLAVHAGVAGPRPMSSALVPMLANMANQWMSIDLEPVLAMSWTPERQGDGSTKTVVNPGRCRS